MSQFYVSIMFIGIVLVVVSFIWILFDRKQAYDYSNGLDEKKSELFSIVEDAEEMLEELNKFSEFIVEQMDAKNEELNAGLKKIDERLKQLNVELEESAAFRSYKTEKVANGNNCDYIGIAGTQFEGPAKSRENEVDRPGNSGVVQNQGNTQQNRAKEKIIPLNGKYNEVLKMSEDGLNVTEIAKKLKMGKGEIQLILGMNR